MIPDIAQLKKEEESCQFERLSHEDIWELGHLLVQHIRTKDRPIAAEIRVNGLTIFSYYPEGTSPYYKTVIDRKHATANYMGKSSLRFYAENEAAGLDPQKDLYLDPVTLQFRGGGFPIRLKNGCVIGSIAVAGMSHEQDHALLVETVKEFLSGIRASTIA